MNNINQESQPNIYEDLKNNLWATFENMAMRDPLYKKEFELVKKDYNFIIYEEALKELGSLEDGQRKYLPENHIKGLNWTKDIPTEKCLFLKGKREEDGTPVYVVVSSMSSRNDFAADIFTPAYYKGHGGNHDFSPHELLKNLYDAVTLPVD